MMLGTLLGGWQIGKLAVQAGRDLAAVSSPERQAYLQGQRTLATFYAEHMLSRSIAYAATVLAGCPAVMELPETLF
jgi:hypothetical protein